MFRLVFLIIFIFFGYNKTHPQLNQQSKKITKTFFEDFTDLQDNTPALKKKKGDSIESPFFFFNAGVLSCKSVKSSKNVFVIFLDC